MEFAGKAVSLALILTVVAGEVFSIEKPIPTAIDYHRKIGIPKAAAIRRWEEENAGKVETSERIIGGWFVDISEFPYQAGLVLHLGWWDSMCGGVLYSASRVVTAAHCVQQDGGALVPAVTVVLGSTWLFSGGHRVRTSDVSIYPGWNANTLANDIAVVRIPNVGFSNVIQPILLPGGNEIHWDFAGWSATATGYGYTHNNDNVGSHQRLSAVNVPIISNAQCSSFFGQWVHGTNICISGEGRRGTCHGDSGGPLAVVIANSRVLVGITSYGSWYGCEAGDPAAFARVTSFVGWLWAQ